MAIQGETRRTTTKAHKRRWSRLALSSVVVRQCLLAFFPTVEIVLQQVDELGRRQRVTAKTGTRF